jgi:hypothetical protein
MVSSERSVYDQALTRLKAARAGIRREQLEDLLRSLGFRVRQAGSAGHRVFIHTELADFRGSNFDGGHGSSPIVKPVYIRKIVRICEDHEEGLRKFLGESVR